MAIYYVTVAGAGDNSGSSWANAMTWSDFATSVVSASAEDFYYFEGGTYTATASVSSASDGAYIIGVSPGTTNEPPIQSDYASGSNRPLFDLGIYSLTLDDSWHILNIRMTGTSSTVFRMDFYGFAKNCYFSNTSGTSNRDAVYSDANFIDCEFISTNGYGLRPYSTGAVLVNCYFHDSLVGLYTNGSDIIGCIFDTCGTGVLSPSDEIFILNNTFYNCNIGINYSTTPESWCYNNIFDSCASGIVINASGVISKRWNGDYNCWNNNTIDMSWDNGSTEDNGAKGIHDVNADPGFVDAANGNFTPTTNVINTGMTMQLGIG